jgi:hypothetical protein
MSACISTPRKRLGILSRQRLLSARTRLDLIGEGVNLDGEESYSGVTLLDRCVLTPMTLVFGRCWNVILTAKERRGRGEMMPNPTRILSTSITAMPTE